MTVLKINLISILTNVRSLSFGSSAFTDSFLSLLKLTEFLKHYSTFVLGVYLNLGSHLGH